MQHPVFGYMQWKLTDRESVEGDGANIASDADLRAIKALMIAQKKWADPKYGVLIDELASGVERVAVTRDGYLAPYGGASGDSAWTADEVWLSYADFGVMRELGERRGDPWRRMYDQMKRATLDAQLENGLYNTELTAQRVEGNGLDAGAYSINSLWIMVRSAESGDAQLEASAREGLEFYKRAFERDGMLFSAYRSDGSAASGFDAPWVYALVGRAAISLDDEEFSVAMVDRLLDFHVQDPRSRMYGAIVEGEEDSPRVGQFTLQESLLTLQDFIREYPGRALRPWIVEGMEPDGAADRATGADDVSDINGVVIELEGEEK